MTNREFNELLSDVAIKLNEAREIVSNPSLDYEDMNETFTYPDYTISQSQILGRIHNAIMVAYDMVNDFNTEV